MTNQWRRYNHAAGRKLLIGGSITALVALIFLVLGVNQYVDATYSEPVGETAPGIILIGVAGASLVGAAILSGVGFIKQRADLQRVRTYDD